MTSYLVDTSDCKVLSDSLSHELYKGILAATECLEYCVQLSQVVRSASHELSSELNME